MTPARSLAASVVALGFAGTLTAPLPAFAAPAPCERAENYAAQSGAELLRIDRLELRATGHERPVAKSGSSATRGDRSDSVREDAVPGATDRLLVPDSPAGATDPGDSAAAGGGAGGLADVLPGSGDAATDERAGDTDGSGGDAGSVIDGFVDATKSGPRSVTSGGLASGGSPLATPDVTTVGDRVTGGLQGELGSLAEQGFSAGESVASGIQPADLGLEGPADLPRQGAADLGRQGAADLGRQGAADLGRQGAAGLDRDAGASGGSLAATGWRSGGSGGRPDAPGEMSQASGGAAAAGSGRSGSGGTQARSREARAGGEAQDGGAVVAGVGLGEAKAALVANARVNSAAVARMVDGHADGKGSLTKSLVQQAPPSNDRGAVRPTAAGQVGPMTIGAGELDAYARWDARMACGNTAGEVASSAASLNRVDILRRAGGALVGVPEKISSRSTTALERRGNDPRTVASATVAAGRLSLAGGRVWVRMLRAPVLTASMATGSGGEIRYRPAMIEVSGPGIKTKRLATVGDTVEVSLGDESQAAESMSLGALSAVDAVRPGSPLPMPTVPGLPSLGTPETESAPAAGAGTEVRISLGDVRQATKGKAIAAMATAIEIAITQGAGTDRQSQQGYGGKARAGVVAEVGFGLLEAAAVAPESTPRSIAGASGGLPITGPQVGLLAAGGLGLLIAGGVAVFLGIRRRRSGS